MKRPFTHAVFFIAAVVVLQPGIPVSGRDACYLNGWSVLGGSGSSQDHLATTKMTVAQPQANAESMLVPLDSQGMQRAESWFAGASGSNTECLTGQNSSGACQARQALGEGPVTAAGTHTPPVTLYNRQCARGAHVWEPSGSGVNSEWCLNVGKSPEEECEDDRNIWIEDDWYPEGGYCEINQDPESPIIIPLTRSQAYKLTSATDGVLFDIDGDGRLEQMAWTAGDSQLAFLALDRNGNGQIDNGTELFGNNTLPGVTDGFEALTKMETQPGGSGGSIDFGDSLYPKLLLWEDRNHNGISEPDELRKASELLTEIGLGYSRYRRPDKHGNEFRYKGWAEVRTSAGRNRSVTAADHHSRLITIYDVFLKVQR